MKRTRIDVTKSRWKSPRSNIAEFSNKLQKTNFFDPAASSEDTLYLFNSSVEQPIADSGSGSNVSATYALPTEIVFLESWMNVDSVGSGQTVEEELTREGDNFRATLPVDFFRGVWYDGLEAVFQEHWTLSGTQYLVPNAALLAGTEVIGRYVVV